MLSDSVIKATDKLRRARKRTAESSEQTLHGQESDREHKASVRAVESSEQTLRRQESDREHKASVASRPCVDSRVIMRSEEGGPGKIGTVKQTNINQHNE